MKKNLMQEFGGEKTCRAVLIGLNTGGADPLLATDDQSIAELRGLLDTAGGECVGVLVQNRSFAESRTLLGEGKVQELKEACLALEADLIVCDNELSPVQIKNLEQDTDVRVIDRSMLILDIFALHAVTGEGKLQVELAQLKYTMPRLMGKGLELSRLGGGIGTRGPGETQLETDRRHLKRKIAALREQLDEVVRNRGVQRKLREQSGVMQVAVVGYTNAGKSSLMNALTGAGILAENKLFATLDTTTKKLRTPGGQDLLLTDTVGFIDKLPHHLVEAFRSSLEEAVFADVLLEVIDASDPRQIFQYEVTNKVLDELGAAGKPRVVVLNKCDLPLPEEELRLRVPGMLCVSASTGSGLEQLLQELEAQCLKGRRVMRVLLPYAQGSLVDLLHKNGCVRTMEYRDEGIFLDLLCEPAIAGKVEKYSVEG